MHRSDFPILNQHVHKHPLVYLDNAATTQKPQVVIDALTEAYTQWNANIHRGVHYLSQIATSKHEWARTYISNFLGAGSSREVLFTRGTTEGINMLAYCFGEAFIGEGDEIIVSGLEHHSNIVPWQMLCARKNAILRVLPLTSTLTFDIEAYKELLTERTKIVSVAQVSNVLGVRTPIEDVIAIAHAHGVPVCVDAAQSAPHIPIDVQALDCDFLVCSGHKMYGPTGIGVLYGKERWLQQLPPYQGGGEMIEHVRWSGTTYNELPYRFEAGTPDYVGAYTLGKAVEYMRQVGMDAIVQHEDALMEYAEEQLSGMKGVHIYAAGQKKVGALSLNVYREDGSLIHPLDIGMLLDQQGVAVRTGHHCAEPLIDLLGVPGTVRVSFAMYNDKSDIDRLVEALERAIVMLT